MPEELAWGSNVESAGSDAGQQCCYRDCLHRVVRSSLEVALRATAGKHRAFDSKLVQSPFFANSTLFCCILDLEAVCRAWQMRRPRMLVFHSSDEKA